MSLKWEQIIDIYCDLALRDMLDNNMSNVSTVRVGLSLCSSRPSSQGFDWRPLATVLLAVHTNDACTIGLSSSQSASIFPNFVSYCFHLECLGAKIWPAVERKMHNYWSGQRLLTSFLEASRFSKDGAGAWNLGHSCSIIISNIIAGSFPLSMGISTLHTSQERLWTLVVVGCAGRINLISFCSRL